MYLDDVDDVELVAGQNGIHEDFGDIQFIEWVDREEGTLLVSRRNSRIEREVYLEDCVFED
jgi:hypothetical protein